MVGFGILFWGILVCGTKDFGGISQDNQPIAFYRGKLNPAQVNYKTTEKELLSIVETLKELRSILVGQQIKVYTNHKSITYKSDG